MPPSILVPPFSLPFLLSINPFGPSNHFLTFPQFFIILSCHLIHFPAGVLVFDRRSRIFFGLRHPIFVPFSPRPHPLFSTAAVFFQSIFHSPILPLPIFFLPPIKTTLPPKKRVRDESPTVLLFFFLFSSSLPFQTPCSSIHSPPSNLLLFPPPTLPPLLLQFIEHFCGGTPNRSSSFSAIKIVTFFSFSPMPTSFFKKADLLLNSLGIATIRPLDPFPQFPLEYAN